MLFYNSIQLHPFGKLAKSSGYKGHFRIILSDDGISFKPGNIEHLFIAINKKPVPFQIEEYDINENTTFIVKLKGIDSKEQVTKFIGAEIFIESKWINSNDTTDSPLFSYKDFQLYDQNHIYIGIIKDIYEISGQTLLEVTTTEKEVLIPFHQELHIRTNKKKKILYLNIAEGLLDI